MQDKSIQKINYLILKKTSLVPCVKRIYIWRGRSPAYSAPWIAELSHWLGHPDNYLFSISSIIFWIKVSNTCIFHFENRSTACMSRESQCCLYQTHLRLTARFAERLKNPNVSRIKRINTRQVAFLNVWLILRVSMVLMFRVSNSISSDESLSCTPRSS